MPTTEWYQTTFRGKRYLVIETAQLRIPLDWDPSSGVFIAVGMPLGGFANIPALVKGDQGFAPTILPAVDFTALEYLDPSPDSATLVEISPATNVAGAVYQLTLALHKGSPGDDGESTLDPSSFGSPLPGQILVVNDTSDGFNLAAQLCGDSFYPAALNSTAANAYTNTLGIVPIPAQLFDIRLEVVGNTIVSPTGSDVRVDLIARLGSTSGNDIGRAFGIAGATERLSICSAPPPGSADSWSRVAAGTAVNVYLRTEQQAGTNTYTTSSSTTRLGVKVNPIPGS